MKNAIPATEQVLPPNAPRARRFAWFGKVLNRMGTRSRIVMLVILAALPALGLSVNNAVGERAAAEAAARESIATIATQAAKQQEEIVKGAQRTLLAASILMPSIHRNAAGCEAYFSALLKGTGDIYHSVGLHRTDGSVYCNAPSFPGINASNRRWFQLTMESRKFSVGEYQVGRGHGQKGISFGYPVQDGSGNLLGAAFLAMNLERFAQLSRIELPEGGVFTVADHAGTILVRHPADPSRIGQPLRNVDVIKAAASGGTAVVAGHGPDGVARLFAYQAVEPEQRGRPPLQIVVSVPREAVFAKANAILVRDVTAILVATLMLIVVAALGADKFVLQKIRTMLDTASRIHRGDFSARTRLRPSRDELSQLGRALDEMAAALQERDGRLHQALRESRELAITDPLTGLHNRRYLWDLLARELLKAQRNGTPIAAILLDIDHFKRVNDAWGHEAGDLVLSRVADVLRRTVRGSDIACRYGGEELAVILPGATAEVAIERGESIRRGIAAMALDYNNKRLDAVTASLGVAVFPRDAADAEALLRAADEALYAAKKAGRNRVVVAGETLPAAA